MENTVRDRITLMLNGLAIQTEYTDHTMCFAAHYLLKAGTEYLAGEPAPGAARTT